jgi:hypothetical protein
LILPANSLAWFGYLATTRASAHARRIAPVEARNPEAAFCVPSFRRLTTPARRQAQRRPRRDRGRDSQGDAWVVDNFMVGAQNQDYFWRGGLSKFAPDGMPLSPAVTGFTGGGQLGPGFGLAIDAHDNAWTTSFGRANTISLLDNSGKPLSPPEGYNFGGKISKMQGVIVTPSGDVWAADTFKSQIVRFPKGAPSKGELLCQNPGGDPLSNPCKLLLPFALAADQKGDSRPRPCSRRRRCPVSANPRPTSPRHGPGRDVSTPRSRRRRAGRCRPLRPAVCAVAGADRRAPPRLRFGAPSACAAAAAQRNFFFAMPWTTANG